MAKAGYIVTHSNKNKVAPRIVIYSRDVENITGLRPRTARLLLQKIRNAFGKKKHQVVTIYEFCFYLGMEEEMVKELLLQ
jgi:hypothetical protein